MKYNNVMLQIMDGDNIVEIHIIEQSVFSITLHIVEKVKHEEHNCLPLVVCSIVINYVLSPSCWTNGQGAIGENVILVQ